MEIVCRLQNGSHMKCLVGLAVFCMFMLQICITVNQVGIVSNSCNQVYIMSVLISRSTTEIIKHGS